MNKNGKPQKNCQICVLLKKAKKLSSFENAISVEGSHQSSLTFLTAFR
jgi:hypothetical protein